MLVWYALANVIKLWLFSCINGNAETILGDMKISIMKCRAYMVVHDATMVQHYWTIGAFMVLQLQPPELQEPPWNYNSGHSSYMLIQTGGTSTTLPWLYGLHTILRQSFFLLMHYVCQQF